MGTAIPGFQDSDHSGPEITVYTHGDDPIVFSPAGGLGAILNGRTQDDSAPSVLTATTNKDLGSASGNFSVALKGSHGSPNLFQKIVDDDWIDISFFKHDNGWHVMRGSSTNATDPEPP